MKDDINLTEEEQVERVKQWWKDNGSSILIGIVLGLSAIFGYQYWQKSKIAEAQAGSDVYQSFINAEDLSIDAVKEKSDLLKGKYKSTPYSAKGVLLSAKHYVDNNDLEAAKSELQWVIANAKDDFVQNVARTRLGAILVEQGNADELEKLAAVKDTGSFAAKFKEFSADVQRLRGNNSQAKSLYEEALELLEDSPYKQVIKLRIIQVSAAEKG